PRAGARCEAGGTASPGTTAGADGPGPGGPGLFLRLRLRFQVRFGFPAGSGGRNIARDPAEEAFAPLAVVEPNRLAQHDLAARRERGHVEPHVFKRDSRIRRDLGVQPFAAVFQVFQDFLQGGYSLFFHAGGMCMHPESGAVFYAKATDLARFPGFRRQGLDRAGSSAYRSIERLKEPSERPRGPSSRSTSRASSPAWLSRPGPSSLSSSFAGSPASGSESRESSEPRYTSDGCAVEWRDSLTGFGAIG